MPKTPMTGFRLDADQRAALARIASHRGCTRTDVIRDGIALVIAAEDQENAPPAGNGRRAEKLAEKERDGVETTAS